MSYESENSIASIVTESAAIRNRNYSLNKIFCGCLCGPIDHDNAESRNSPAHPAGESTMPNR